MRLGAALDFDADMGSLTTGRQLATVEAHVEDALSKGARLLAGGRRRPDVGPLFYEPTVLTGVAPGMTVHDEETFGPVVALYSVRSDEEAIERANASRYGLNASVWSGSAGRAMRVARRLQAGMVNVNEAYAATWGSTAAPAGGVKESGLGRRHGEEGLLKYTTAQTIAVQRGLPIAPRRPHRSRHYARVMTTLVRLMRHLPGLG
jgi:succinate-semialdehyde dehydrogenase/glutarate-semialdehyde dehydrogenase